MRLRVLTAPVFAGFTVAGVVNLLVAVYVDNVDLVSQATGLLVVWFYSQGYRWAVAPAPTSPAASRVYVPVDRGAARLLAVHEEGAGRGHAGPWPYGWPYRVHGDGRVVCTRCQRIVLIDHPG